MSLIARTWDRFCAVRFLVVGGWNALFSYGVFALLYHVWGGGWGDVVVQAVGAVVGITNSYVCHRIFTYRAHGIWWKEYLRFYIVYGGQVLLQAGAFFILSTWFGLNGYIVQFVLMIVFTAVSYWAHKSYSFRMNTKGEIL